MRLFSFMMVVLIGAVLVLLSNLYVSNYNLFNREVMLYGDTHMRVWAFTLVVLAVGFLINLFYNGYAALRDMVKGLNASAATRMGRRLSSRLTDARALIAHGLLSKAKVMMEEMYADHPEHVGTAMLYGDVMLKSGEGEAAAKHFEKFCLKHPDHVEARYQLAEALLASRNSDGAMGVLKKIVSSAPKQALRGLRRLRALHTEAQRWEEALDMHKKLVSHFSGELSAGEKAQGMALTYQAGLLKVDADQYKDAAQAFQQVVKDDPGFIPAYLSLGRCRILQDQEDQGLEIWVEGFRSTGEGAFLQEIEDYFIQSGRPEEGLAVLRRISATSEHAVLAKFFLGKMLYRLEILDEALEQFLEVRSQVVYSPILYFYMAKIHSRRGRLDAALNEYRQLLRNLGVLKLRFECGVCGHRTTDYTDRCEHCAAWNSSHFLFKENEMPEVPLRGESGQWITMG